MSAPASHGGDQSRLDKEHFARSCERPSVYLLNHLSTVSIRKLAVQTLVQYVLFIAKIDRSHASTIRIAMFFVAADSASS